jgi:hypothetical protein
VAGLHARKQLAFDGKMDIQARVVNAWAYHFTTYKKEKSGLSSGHAITIQCAHLSIEHFEARRTQTLMKGHAA